MLSLESRRDPVHQASLAFFLLAGLVVAGAAVTHDKVPIVYPAVMSLVGFFAWRRSLAALLIGTLFFALLAVLGIGHTVAHGVRVSTLVVIAIVHGSLLFVMARGLVSKWRAR
jgi:hypothetical protein